MPEEKIGVYICHCGTNIAGKVDVAEVTRWAAEQPNVAVAREYKYMCSDPGQDLIRQDIQEHGITRAVVAACSPTMHEPTFRKAAAGCRAQPLPAADGQHPRALLVGDGGPGRGHREGQAHPRAPRSTACPSTRRSSRSRSRSTRT